MRADEPIKKWENLCCHIEGIGVLDYINQLRVDRLMRGKKIAELEFRIAHFEYLEAIIDNKEYFAKRKEYKRISEAYEAMAKRIKEGM